MSATAGTVAPVPQALGDRAALLDRADLLLCLARAFMPPPEHWSVCDWAQPLADDLNELGTALAIDMRDIQAALAAECERWTQAMQRADSSADSWLVEYTRLFLVPPVPVTLNTGLYLEGSLGGTSARMMQVCYETAGIGLRQDFHDLPDHVASQLEFLGLLYERAARGDTDAADMAEEFSQEFIHAWAGPLEAACTQAQVRYASAKVFAALARLVRATVGDAEQP